MTEETTWIDSQPAYLLDGVTDDYEDWNGDLPEAQRENNTVASVGSLNVVTLKSGAWKTYVVLQPYARQND